MVDYHLHTSLCKHASGEIDEYIEQAIAGGLEEICFTDHIPLPDNFDFAHRMTTQEMDWYQKEIERARSDYPEITIRFGIEADYYEGFEKYLEKFLSRYDFDLVIMSVHFVRHWQNGNWVFNYAFPDKSPADIYREYLSEVGKGIKTGLFDIIGHIDLIKQKNHSLLPIVPEKVTEILTLAGKYNMAIEINSSGLRKDVNECYPGFDWLTHIGQLNLAVTVGSDAHAPEQVGFRFNQIYQQLRLHKIATIARYKKRRIVALGNADESDE